MMLAPDVQHTLMAAPSGWGKSEACLTLTIPRLDVPAERRPALLMVDPPGRMVRKAAYCCTHLGIDFLYEEVSETKNTLGYDYSGWSTNPDPEQREAENNELKTERIALYMQHRGVMDDRGNPIISEGLNDAMDLSIHQLTPKPIWKLDGCFERLSENHKLWLDGCTNKNLRMNFQMYGRLRPRDWEFKCAPAARILRKFGRMPAFRARCVQTFDMAAFFNRGGALLVSAKSGIDGTGNLGRQDASFIFTMIIREVLRLARAGRLTRRIIIVIDEGINADLIDLHIARALAEMRGMSAGVEFILIIQNPLRFADPVITESIRANCSIKFIFRTNDPRYCDEAADIVGTPHFNPLEVKYVERRARQVEGRVIEIPTETVTVTKDEDGNTRKGVSKGTSNRTMRETVYDDVEHHFTPEERRQRVRRKLMTQGVGECFIVKGNYVSQDPVYIPMRKMPWDGLLYSRYPRVSLAEFKLQQKLLELKKTPPYQNPVSADETGSSVESASGSSSSDLSTQARFRKCSTSTKGAKTRTSTRTTRSPGSTGKESSNGSAS